MSGLAVGVQACQSSFGQPYLHRASQLNLTQSFKRVGEAGAEGTRREMHGLGPLLGSILPGVAVALIVLPHPPLHGHEPRRPFK